MPRPTRPNAPFVATTVYLRPDQLKRLRERQAAFGAPIAESIRRAIDAYLKVKP